MDEIVLRAMAKWPNVPAVYGWLTLDRRGRWFIKGDAIGNPMIIDCIGRNYAADESGRWFFQNGPQRVFVSVAYMPLVLGVTPERLLVTHTAKTVHALNAAWIDPEGNLIVATEHGPSLLDDRDAETISTWFIDHDGKPLDEDIALERVEKMQLGQRADLLLAYGRQTVRVEPIEAGDIGTRFGFIADPRPDPCGEVCT